MMQKNQILRCSVIVSLALCHSTNVEAWETTFGEPEVVYQRADGFVTADLNGDGLDDYLSFSGNLLQLSLNREGGIPGDFTKPERVVVDSLPLEPMKMIPADVDNDGDDDLIVLSALNYISGWYEVEVSETERRFVAHPIYDPDNDRHFKANHLVLLDMNDDGFLDIVFENSGYLKFLSMNPDPTDSSMTPLTLTNSLLSSTSGLFLCDVDGDNDHDIVRHQSDMVYWHENNTVDGRPAFANAEVLFPTTGRIQKVLPLDFDEDGKMDFVSSELSSDSTSNNGPLSYYVYSPIVTESELSYTSRTLIADTQQLSMGQVLDLDGDGDEDIVGQLDGGYGWIENLKEITSGTVSNIKRMSHSGNASLFSTNRSYHYWVNLDGDEDIDLAFQSGWLETGDDETGLSFQEVHIISPDTSVVHLETVDIDLDGDEDLLIESSDYIAWIENDPNNIAWPAISGLLITKGFSYGPSLYTDLNGDGFLDILYLDHHNSRLVYHLNKGEIPVSFVDPIELPFGLPENYNLSMLRGSPQLGDLDGDGVQDLVLFLNSPDGGFGGTLLYFPIKFENEPITIGDAKILTENVVGFNVIDIDLDHDVDILTVPTTRDRVQWLENRDDDFLPASDLIEIKDVIHMYSYTSRYLGKNYLLLRSGQTIFTYYIDIVDGAIALERDRLWILRNHSGLSSLATNDFNLDGEIDIVGSIFDFELISTITNYAVLFWLQPSITRILSDELGRLAATDFNGDLYPEIFVYDNAGKYIKIFANQTLANRPATQQQFNFTRSERTSPQRSWVFRGLQNAESNIYLPYEIRESLEIRTSYTGFGSWLSPTFQVATDESALSPPSIPLLVDESPVLLSVQWNGSDSSQYPKPLASSPTLRYRASPDHYASTNELVITSTGDAILSPTRNGREYRQFFTLPDAVERFFLAFDVIHYDPTDANRVLLMTDDVTVSSVAIDSLNRSANSLTIDFRGNSHGFQPVSPESDLFDLMSPASFLATDRGLAIRGSESLSEINETGQEITFGFWDGGAQLPITGERLYKATWTVGSDATEEEKLSVPTFRLRLNDSGLQYANLLNVDSFNESSLIPTDGNSQSYTQWIYAPEELDGRDWLLAFDYLTVRDAEEQDDDPRITLYLEQVTIEEFTLE